MHKSNFLILFLGLFTIFAGSAFAQPRAYIPNLNSDEVSVVNTGTNTLVTTIDVGDRPNSAAVTPDGTKVYVVNNGSPGTVSVIQASTNTVIDTINVGTNPTDVVITPDGSFAYVSNFNSFSVSKIDTATDSVVDTIILSTGAPSLSPGNLAITPDGAFIYVLITNSNTQVFRIRTSDDTVVGPFISLGASTSMDISPDGSKLYIGIFSPTDGVQIIDAIGNPTLGTFIVLDDGAGNSATPRAIAVDPDGDLAWVLTTPGSAIPFNVGYVLINTMTDAASLIGGVETFSSLGFTRDGVSFYGINILGFTKEVPAVVPIVPGTQINLQGQGSGSNSPYFIGPDMSDLTVTKTGNGDGTVTSMPPGIDCGSTCTAVFTTDSDVVLTAVADADSNFTGWSEDCSGTNPDTTITVMTTSECEAEFALIQFNVDINLPGTGSGTVTTDPAGIDCPGICSSPFDINSNIDLNQAANFDSVFVGWTGDPDCTDGVISNLSGDISCTATFDLMMFNLTANKSGTGTGSITSNPAGISCDNACASDNADYVINTMVTLTATANASDSFLAGWSGDCSSAGVNTDATVTMDQAMTCTATFNDIDDCEPNPCENSGVCADTGSSSFSCDCTDTGFEGDMCQTNIDECTLGTDNCDVNATCTNTPGSFTCECDEGFTGDGVTCDDVDACMDNPCDINATCTDIAGAPNDATGRTCECNEGFTGNGETCEPEDTGGEGDGDGDMDSDNGDDNNGGGGCSVASTNTSMASALSNFFVMLFPAIVGFGAMFWRRRA